MKDIVEDLDLKGHKASFKCKIIRDHLEKIL